MSGIAHLSRDPAKIRELYAADWRAWFGDEGGVRNGGPEDPRLVLVLVEAQSATYLKAKHGKVITLFNVVKGAVTGQRPDVGTTGDLSRDELRQGRGSKKL